MIQKLQPYVLKAVRELVDKRKSNHIEPAVATRPEILGVFTNAVKEILDELERDNIIGSYLNVNQIKMYYVISDKTKDISAEIQKKGGGK